MSFEIKDFKGSLFKNDKKTSEKSPDYTGKVKINGIIYYAAAWKETSSKGKEYMSLSFQLPKDKDTAAQESAQEPDEDLPF